MQLELIPLLRIQRDLYDLPRGWERFNAYLATMTHESGDAELLPLVAMNPMGREHVAARLDTLLAMDAESIVAGALDESRKRLTRCPGNYRVGLVVSDDAQGGWTNRYFAEMSLRFGGEAAQNRAWITVALWSSETPSIEQVREATLAAIFRMAHAEQRGWPRTLREMLAQEGSALAFAGAQMPSLDPEDLAYIGDVIRPYLDHDEYPAVMVCLFGDEAAYSLGYPMLGLPDRAGFALALHDALQRSEPPEAGLGRSETVVKELADAAR